eukprot:SAG25_NODE_1229_length_3559_cov_2.298266_1_plen_164_part_10
MPVVWQRLALPPRRKLTAAAAAAMTGAAAATATTVTASSDRCDDDAIAAPAARERAAALAASYREHGVLILRGVLPRALTQALRAEVHSRFEEEGRRHSRRLGNGNGALRVGLVTALTPAAEAALRRVTGGAVTGPLYSALLPASAELVELGAIRSLPRCGAQD